MLELDWLLDTNILLRFSPLAGTNYPDVRRSVTLLQSAAVRLYYTSQTLSEFWNVCTRPLAANGMGLTITQAQEIVLTIESSCTLAPDSLATHQQWRRLVVEHQVAGIQVHDARIVANMLVNRIPNLLTLNPKDFRRYPLVTALTPAELLASQEQL